MKGGYEVPATEVRLDVLQKQLGFPAKDPRKVNQNFFLIGLFFPSPFAFSFLRTINSGYFPCSQGPWVDRKA